METTPTTPSVTTSDQSTQLISISQLLAQAFTIYKTHFWKMMGMYFISMVAYIPMGLIAGLFYLTYNYENSLGSAMLMVIYIVLGLLGLATIIAAIYVYLIAQVGMYLIIRDQNNNPKFWETFKAARPSAISFFETNFLTGIFLILWFLLFIIPGVMMAVYYSFVTWVFVVEGLKNKAAMRRSKELVKGHWWNIFWIMLLPMVVVWFILGLPSYFIEPESGADQIYSAVNNILSAVITPFFLAYTYHLYKNLVGLKKS